MPLIPKNALSFFSILITGMIAIFLAVWLEIEHRQKQKKEKDG